MKGIPLGSAQDSLSNLKECYSFFANVKSEICLFVFEVLTRKTSFALERVACAECVSMQRFYVLLRPQSSVDVHISHWFCEQYKNSASDVLCVRRFVGETALEIQLKCEDTITKV